MSSLFGKNKRKRVVETSSGPVDDESLVGPSQAAAVTTMKAGNDGKHNDNHDEGERQQNDTNLVVKSYEKQQQQQPPLFSTWATFADLGLAEPLQKTCRSMGYSRPTPVQRCMIPFLLQNETQNVMCLAATGSGKTAAFVLPILQKLQADPYGIYCTILTPTRELAKQIHQQVLAFGTNAYRVQSVLCIGGLDLVHQSCQLDKRPHFCVATPGRLADLLRGPNPPNLNKVRYMVLDEADRLLASSSGFERDVAEVLLHTTKSRHCQTLLFSATMTRSLESMEELAGAGRGRMSLQKFVIEQDSSKKQKKANVEENENPVGDHQESLNEQDEHSSNVEDGTQKSEEQASSTPTIPAGLKQEYVFMPSRVRDAYLLTTIRTLMQNGGRRPKTSNTSGGRKTAQPDDDIGDDDDDDANGDAKAQSAIVFVSTCERCALVSGILHELGVDNVALHSLLSQNRRLAALGKFQSQHVRLLIATDVASRGLDIPSVDLVINAELPRTAVNYIHRVGRTARAGRRGRAISLVGEADVALVKAAETLSGRVLEKCPDITDDKAIALLGPVTKASRLAKMKLMDIGFDELVKKQRERKMRDRKERQRIERRLRKMEASATNA